MKFPFHLLFYGFCGYHIKCYFQNIDFILEMANKAKKNTWKSIKRKKKGIVAEAQKRKRYSEDEKKDDVADDSLTSNEFNEPNQYNDEEFINDYDEDDGNDDEDDGDAGLGSCCEAKYA